MGESNTVYADTTDKLSGQTGLKKVKLTKEFMFAFCIVVANLGAYSCGLFVGWSSHTALAMVGTYSTENIARIVSYLALGAAISPVIANKLWYAIGTKLILLFGGLIMSTSVIGLYINYGLYGFLASRFVSGLAVGIIHHLFTCYVQEVTANPAASQTDISRLKKLHTAVHLTFMLGVLTMFITGFYDLPQLSCMIMVIASSLFTIGVCLLPESPRFLCYRDREDEARVVLSMFLDIDNFVEHKMMMWSEMEQVRVLGFREFLCGKSFPSRNIITGFGALVFRQLLGVTMMLHYMEKLFSLTDGQYSPKLNAVFCVGLLVTALIVGCVYTFPIDGHKWLVWSTAFLGALWFVFGFHCHYRGTFGHSTSDHNLLLPLFMFAAAFTSYTYGPMLTIDSVIHKLGPRDSFAFTYMCLTVSVEWLTVFALTRGLPDIVNSIGLGWMLWYSTVMCALAALFFNYVVPSDFDSTPEIVDEEKLVGRVVFSTNAANSISSTRSCSERNIA